MAKKAKILYTEDDYETFKLVSEILSEYEVVWATGIGVAVRQIAFNRHHLYLIDYNLPDGTGFELSRIIRNEDIDTPILFVTGNSTLFPEDAAAAGGQGIITKGQSSFGEDLMSSVDRLTSRQAKFSKR